MFTKKDKTYKYATEEEYKDANKEKAKQRYYQNRDEIRQQQREYYRKQREMADKYKVLQAGILQFQDSRNFMPQCNSAAKCQESQMPIIEVVGTSPISLDISQIEKLLTNGQIVTPAK